MHAGFSISGGLEMEIDTNQYKHSDLVKPHGRIDSATAPQLAKVLDEITDSGRFKIILDLSDVDFMSSAGLRVLISTQKTCKRYNRGEIVLASVPKRIHDALDLAGFIPLFKFYDNALDAVGSI
jgi:anti-sigma B factor antagonist